MAESLSWLGALLDGQIKELTRQSRATLAWTWVLGVVGIVSCVGLYIYCTISDLEKAVSFGPGLVSASAALPFRSVMALRQKLTLMVGLRARFDDEEQLSETDYADFVDLVKEALKSGLKA